MYQVILIFASGAHAWITKGKKRIPSWSGFYKPASKPELDRITVGYLPPLPFAPTKTKVIGAEIRRTQDIMKELEAYFIFIETNQGINTKVLDVMFALKNR